MLFIQKGVLNNKLNHFQLISHYFFLTNIVDLANIYHLLINFNFHHLNLIQKNYVSDFLDFLDFHYYLYHCNLCYFIFCCCYYCNCYYFIFIIIIGNLCYRENIIITAIINFSFSFKINQEFPIVKWKSYCQFYYQFLILFGYYHFYLL